jgi:alkanesulfonate monooxygenase SsuD/methylene tetrahydromethanopterin reductase-like flavin-dependent oxidoreductase (luciferase family)
MISRVKEAAEKAGRDPEKLTFCVAAPAYVGAEDEIDHMRSQTRWFGGMVGNHIADIVSKYGEASEGNEGFPQVLVDYIKGRTGYDYNTHGKADNDHVDFVPDEIVDRFCILGTPEQHVEKLKALHEIGVDQFSVYLQHDNKEETMRVYGESIMPHLRDHVTAKA